MDCKKFKNLIRLNSFISENLPMCRCFNTDITSWNMLKQITGDRDIIAGLYNKQIYSFENDEIIKDVFKEHVLSDIKDEMLPNKDLFKEENSVYIGLLYKLIKHTLIKRGAVEYAKNKYFISQFKSFENTYVKYLAVNINIKYIKGNCILCIRPTYYLTDENGNIISDDLKLLELNALMSNLYNKYYYEEFRNIYRLLAIKCKNELKIIFKKDNFLLEFKNIPIECKGNFEQQKKNIFQSFIFPEPLMTFGLQGSQLVKNMGGTDTFGGELMQRLGQG